MSNTNNYKSTGTLVLKGKKLRGTMVAEERLATFTAKGKTIEMPCKPRVTQTLPPRRSWQPLRLTEGVSRRYQ